MLRWLRFPTTHDLVTDYMYSIDPSYRKKQYLEQQLSDAQWILDYERRLAALQKEIAPETGRATHAGRNPRRLHKLSRELAHLRANLAEWWRTA